VCCGPGERCCGPIGITPLLFPLAEPALTGHCSGLSGVCPL
jgi:hypothetical protein